MHIDDMIRLAPAVTLEQMLDARERRAARQKHFLSAHPDCALVSFTMNIPGQYKSYPLAERGYERGVETIERQLSRMGIETAEREEVRAVTGCEFLLAARAPDEAVKRVCVAIEESHPLGRLFDIDVLGADGAPLRGSDQGRETRACVVCGGPVWECARSRAHPAEQLARKAGAALRDYFAGEFADAVAACATRALLYEVNVTPKPGLVDRTNNGAHTDMSIFTFIDSSVALTPFFRTMALAGLEWEDGAAALLPRLRLPGMWAEDAMFAATGGVNTHKGLIFSLGIVCAATGLAAGAERGGEGFDAEEVLGICGEMAAATPEELERMKGEAEERDTHGEAAFRRFGLTGARGEAARGFPDVRECSLPVLGKWLAEGATFNDAGVAALLALLGRVEDTNIVTRSNLSTLREVQGCADDIVKRFGDDLPSLLLGAEALDAEFIEQGLSAGGCADLLALTFMLTFLKTLRPPFR